MCRSMSKEKQRSRDALSNAVSAERQWENLSAARTGREARRASEIPKPENFDELTDMNTWAGASQEANLVQCIEGVKISSS